MTNLIIPVLNTVPSPVGKGFELNSSLNEYAFFDPALSAKTNGSTSLTMGSGPITQHSCQRNITAVECPVLPIVITDTSPRMTPPDTYSRAEVIQGGIFSGSYSN